MACSSSISLITNFVVVIKISKFSYWYTISYHHKCLCLLCFNYLNNFSAVTLLSSQSSLGTLGIVMVLFHVGFYHETVLVGHQEIILISFQEWFLYLCSSFFYIFLEQSKIVSSAERAWYNVKEFVILECPTSKTSRMKNVTYCMFCIRFGFHCSIFSIHWRFYTLFSWLAGIVWMEGHCCPCRGWEYGICIAK